MNRLLLPLLLLALWLILGSLFIKNKLCGIVDSPKNTETAVVSPPKNSDRLLIEDGTAFRTTAVDHFDFNSSSFNYLTPLAADVNNSLSETAAYLKANPNRSLLITGLYKSEEENSSGVFATLGLARANEVKKALSDLGVSGKQLLTADRLLSASTEFKDGVLLNGVKFDFNETAIDTAERLAAIKAKYDANPITIYFNTGEQNVALTLEQREAFSDLVFYLDNVAGSSLEVGGHTDDKGDIAMNKRLSRKRAEFVRDYLTGNGLDPKRLNAQGYGPDAPIASNNSSEGRAKNRRVEVRLR